MKITIPGCASITVQDRRWFVLRMKTNYDMQLRMGTTDAVFAALKADGYDAYVPRRRLDKFNRRMRVMAEWSEPLMPGYLFLVHPRPGQPIDDWTEVKKVKGVIGPLGDAFKPLLIPAKVIEALMTAEFSSAYDDTAAARKSRGETERQRLQARFQKGGRFRIADGPFASFLATVDELTQDGRVKALVDIFGRMSVIDLDPGSLERGDGKRDPSAA